MIRFHGDLLPTFHGQAYNGKETLLLGDHPENPIVIVPEKKSYLTFEQRQRLIRAIESLGDMFEVLTALTTYHVVNLHKEGKEYPEYPEVVKQAYDLIEKIAE